MINYPPVEFFDKVIENCPKAAFVYTKVWREKKEDFTISYDKHSINHEHFMHWKRFKTDLRLLKKEKVLNYAFNDTDDSVIITFTIPHSNEKVA